MSVIKYLNSKCCVLRMFPGTKGSISIIKGPALVSLLRQEMRALNLLRNIISRWHFPGNNRPLHTHLSRVVSVVEQHYPDPRVFTLLPPLPLLRFGFMSEQLSCAAVLVERGHTSRAVRKVFSYERCFEQVQVIGWLLLPSCSLWWWRPVWGNQ